MPAAPAARQAMRWGVDGRGGAWPVGCSVGFCPGASDGAGMMPTGPGLSQFLEIAGAKPPDDSPSRSVPPTVCRNSGRTLHRATPRSGDARECESRGGTRHPGRCLGEFNESPWSRASPGLSPLHTGPADWLPLSWPSPLCKRSPESAGKALTSFTAAWYRAQSGHRFGPRHALGHRRQSLPVHRGGNEETPG